MVWQNPVINYKLLGALVAHACIVVNPSGGAARILTRFYARIFILLTDYSQSAKDVDPHSKFKICVEDRGHRNLAFTHFAEFYLFIYRTGQCSRPTTIQNNNSCSAGKEARWDKMRQDEARCDKMRQDEARWGKMRLSYQGELLSLAYK